MPVMLGRCLVALIHSMLRLLDTLSNEIFAVLFFDSVIYSHKRSVYGINCS